MEGPVQWAVLSFFGGVAVACAIAGFVTRGFFAGYDAKIAELKSHFNISIAGLSNAIQDRNFLIDIKMAIADITKDVRHLKANFEQHQIAAGEEHDLLGRIDSEVTRIGKIVNGK